MIGLVDQGVELEQTKVRTPLPTPAEIHGKRPWKHEKRMPQVYQDWSEV